MSLSEQVHKMQQRLADLKRALDTSRPEANQQLRDRIAEAVAAGDASHQNRAGEAADRARSRWQSLMTDFSARLADVQQRTDRRRDDLDVKDAQHAAELAENDAADAIDLAVFAIDQAVLAVLDAVDARAWADARASVPPPA